MNDGPPDPFDDRRLGPASARAPLHYGTADAPRRAGRWWFVLAVLLAGAVSFGGVWAVFEYRARRPTGAVQMSPPAGQSGLPPLTGPLPSGVSPGLAPAQVASPYDARPGQIEAAGCATNLRHVAAALQAWANRHDWRLPDRLEDLVAAGLLDPKDLLCPTAESLPSFDSFTAFGEPGVAGEPAGAGAGPTTGPAGARSTYVYLGQGLTTPAGFDTVVLYEPPRHFGGVAMNVLFGDGSVRMLTGDDGRRLIALAASGQRPVEFPADRPGPAGGVTTKPAS